MIVTLTLNPALDKSFRIEHLQADKKLRCTDLRVDAGGGGINVSRAVHILGGSTLALFPAGGCAGERLVAELQAQGIPVQSVLTRTETRESLSAFDTKEGHQYRFVLPGSPLDAEVLEQLLQYALPPDAGWLVISGSMPPQLPAGYLARWVEKATGAGFRVLGDSSGAALQELLGAGVAVIKPSLSELTALSGKSVLPDEEVEPAARQLIGRYAVRAVIVSLGPSGALLVEASRTWRFAAPPAVIRSSAGAGDSMVSGLLWMLEEGAPLEDAVAFGVACGTASTLREGTQLFTKEEVERYYRWVLEKRERVRPVTA